MQRFHCTPSASPQPREVWTLAPTLHAWNQRFREGKRLAQDYKEIGFRAEDGAEALKGRRTCGSRRTRNEKRWIPGVRTGKEPGLTTSQTHSRSRVLESPALKARCPAVEGSASPGSRRSGGRELLRLLAEASVRSAGESVRSRVRLALGCAGFLGLHQGRVRDTPRTPDLTVPRVRDARARYAPAVPPSP